MWLRFRGPLDHCDRHVLRGMTFSTFEIIGIAVHRVGIVGSDRRHCQHRPEKPSVDCLQGPECGIKPAELTPLTALVLADCFLEAGLPGAVLSVVTGHGTEIGDALVADPRVRKVPFTGSTAVGERISRTAGVKKLSLELGASSPVVILPDADLSWPRAPSPPAATPSGQVCISVQRVITHPAVTATSSTRSCRASRPSAPATRRGTTPPWAP